MKTYYRNIAPMHDRIFHGQHEGEFYEMDQYLLELLKRWCPEHAHKILEAGCGTGFWVDYLTKITRAKIVGVDSSPDMLKIAKERFSKNAQVELHEGDVRNMDFLADSTFDLTFCAWILQYLVRVDDFRKGLKELKRVTKPGGFLVLAEDSPPTRPPFTDCLVEKDELGGIYFYQDEYEGMTFPVYRRLLESKNMVSTLKDEGLDLLREEQKISLKVYIGVRKE